MAKMAMPIQVKGVTYLNTSEAMGRLGVSRPTFDKLVKDGRLPQYRQGIRNLPYYRESDVNELLEMRRADNED
jgi:excisionase family DNA binding protein